MEEYIARAMEVGRLTDDELTRLQAREKDKILRPFEIQNAFKLCTLKEQYGIPIDNDSAQNAHKNRIKNELSQLKLSPLYDFNVTQVIGIHEFDWKVKMAVKEGKISFYCQSGGSGSKRATEAYGD